MKVTAGAAAQYDEPIEALFARATDGERIAAIVRPTGPLPGVARVTLLAGAIEQGRGVQREVLLTDHSSVRETITVWDPPRMHAYRIDSFTGPLALLATHIDSRWTFSPREKGRSTHIEWTYDVHLTSALAAPFALPLTRFFLRAFLQSALERLRAR